MTDDINLLNIEQNQNDRRERGKPRAAKKLLKFLIYITVISTIVLFAFTGKILMSEDSGLLKTFSFISSIRNLAQTSDNMLKGEESGRINILMLGMGGRSHEGGYLTDTIMLASIIPSSKEVAMLSIPRDLIIPVEGYGWRKINHINAYAEMEKAGSGGLAVSQALSRVLDMPIDYYIRADFDGFVQVIDELGGIDIEVENVINDPSYPIMGREEANNYDSRFEHLYIPTGQQHLDGSLALKYVRSRHTPGIEGSDFARSRRQQKVIEAVKNKFLSKTIIFKPRLVSNVLDALEENISTNFKVWDIVKLWSMVKEVGTNDIVMKVLDNSEGGYLIDSITAEGAYVLEPRSGDYDEIQYLAHNIFTGAPPQQKQVVSEELPKLEIQNGTWVNGLGQRTASDLEKFGFEISNINNAARQDHVESIVYDLTYGEKIESLEILKERVGARVHYGLPDWLGVELEEQNIGKAEVIQPDFILILGQDADKTKSGLENEEE